MNHINKDLQMNILVDFVDSKSYILLIRNHTFEIVFHLRNFPHFNVIRTFFLCQREINFSFGNFTVSVSCSIIFMIPEGPELL